MGETPVKARPHADIRVAISSSIKVMKEIVRTTDLVRLSWLQALLADADIPVLVLDSHMSVMEGSINAIPRRLMVDEADAARARLVLEEAGEALSGD